VKAATNWERCRRNCEDVLARLDWEALGAIYFHWGGAQFWRERRPQVVALGLEIARGVLRRVGPAGSSLWAGAGVAELPILLAETTLRGRTVRAVNLRQRECDVLNAGLASCQLGDTLRYAAGDAGEAAAAGTYDHLGCVSLFTDPETWPLLSDVTYGRVPPVQIDVERFAAEREQARALAKRLFAGLRRPGWITTSAEEVAWFLEQAEAVGARYEADDDLLETAVVGDPVGFVRVA
jgi:hypothetical protein